MHIAHAPNQINMGKKRKKKSKRHSEEEFSTIYAVLSYQLALASVSSSRCRIFWYKPSTSDLLRGSTALYSKYPSHSNEPSPSLWDYPRLTWGSQARVSFISSRVLSIIWFSTSQVAKLLRRMWLFSKEISKFHHWTFGQCFLFLVFFDKVKVFCCFFNSHLEVCH